METVQRPKSMTILDKVQRLLALAQSSNPHEAAQAAAEAQRLMMKHGIESAELNQPQTVDQIIIETGALNTWYNVLAQHVAKATFCTIYGLTGAGAGKSSGKLALCGYKDDMVVASVLLAWLAQEINRLCEIEWQELKSKQGVNYHQDYKALPSANAWKKSFRMGACSTIGQRLAEDRKKAKAELDLANQSIALVRLETYSNEAALAVRSFLAKSGTRLSSSKSIGPRNSSAYGLGLEAGKYIGLQPPKKALVS